MKKVLALLLSLAVGLPSLPIMAYAEAKSMEDAAIEAAAAASEAEIDRIAVKKEMGATGGPLNVMIFGNNLKSGVEIKAFVDEEEAGIKFERVLEEDNRMSFYTSIPENTTTSPVVYRIEAYPTGRPKAKKTGTLTVEAAKIVEYNSKVKTVGAVKSKYGYVASRAVFEVTGEELERGGLDFKVEKDGKAYNPLGDFAFIKTENGMNVSFMLDENKGETPYVYEFFIKGKKEENYKSAEITQRGLQTYVLIKKLTKDNYEISEGGERIQIDLEYNKDFSNNPQLEIKSGGEKVNALVEPIASDDAKKKTIYVTLPANTVKEEKIYTIKFRTDTESFLEEPVVTVKQSALSDKTVFAGIKTRIDNLPLKGGQSSVTITGANLLPSNMRIEATKLVGKDYVPATEKELKLNEFDGREEVATCIIDFMPVTEKTTYKFVVTDTKYNNRMETLIILSEEGSILDLRNLNPENMYYINDTTFKLAYNEPVIESRKDAVLKYARISKTEDGEKHSLPAGTEISFDESGITIDVKEWQFKKEGSGENDYKNIFIHFPQRIIETTGSNAYQNKKFQFIIRELGVVETSEFIEGQVLDHNGGQVHLRITGHNFDKDKIKARVAKQEPLRRLKDGKIGVTELSKDDIEVVATSNQIDVKFSLPKNKTNRIENYIVLLSFDGVNYSAEYAQSMNDRAKRMVVAVKNEGLDTTEPVLGFAKITSYETNPLVNGVPDSLHTITPINQESKKTFVYLYGMNLNQKRTKIRALDEYGVYFSPVFDSSADSGNRFMLVDWAILGNNNNQFIEIIAPRGYMDDQTYIYQIAVDGKNFNEDIVVRATVKYDGENQVDKKKLLCEVKLNFVDENGRVIHDPVTLKGYRQLPPDTVSMLPIDIEGYKYAENHSAYDLHHKSLAKFSPQILEGKVGEITYVYKNLNPKEEVQISEDTSSNTNDTYTEYAPDKKDSTDEKVEDNKTPLGTAETDAKEVFDIPEIAPMPEVEFEDVKETKYEKEITELAKYGIIKGMDDKRIEPERVLTKAMFVEMLYRISKDKQGENTNLKDLKEKDWFFNSASWASSKGLVIGDAKGNFQGNKNLSAAEVAVILDRFITKFKLNLNEKNAGMVISKGHWASEAINKMAVLGLMSDKTKTGDMMTREEVAKVIYELLTQVKVIK